MIPDAPAPLAQAAGSAITLLREILENDRAAIAEMRRDAPWYQPPSELVDLHRRIEECLSPNAAGSPTGADNQGGQNGN